MILVIVTLLVGVTVFVVTLRHAEELLSENLQSSLFNRTQLTQVEIRAGFESTVVVATRPLLIGQMERLNSGEDDDAARLVVNEAAKSFLGTGLTAIAFLDKDGREVAQAGTFAQQPALTVPLALPGHAELMWDGQMLLHVEVAMKREGRVVGKVKAQTMLPTTTAAFKEASSLGKTAEQLLCASLGLQMQCFPSVLNQRVLTIAQRSPNGDRLPMAYALAGNTGLVITRDYRQEEVVAAYSPVGDLGLGMVLKIDSAELYAPVWKQLRYLVPLLFGVLAIALLLLRWLLTPLVRRLVGSENEAAQRTVELTTEIADHKQAEAELLRFRNVLNNTLDMIFMFDPQSLRFVYVNQGAILSMGHSQEELLGMTPCQINPLLPELEFRQLIAPMLSGNEVSLRFETLHRRKDLSDFPADVVLQLMTEGDGRRLFVAIVRDVTEKNRSEELIWRQANFDALTGLPNRRMFYDRLEQGIKISHRSGLPMVIMLLDLDRFKEVNDTLGHAQGDVLLIEAARRIAACVRESDTVARLGGDEFTVILSEVNDSAKIECIARNIIARLAAPFQLLQETAFVSASVGITVYPDDGQSIDTLVANADQAMYLAKNSGRNRFSYFTGALQQDAQARLRLSNDLRTAMAGKQLAVYYQPIVELATGNICKAEALLRWRHPERGMVSPLQFIPLAEESGLIHEMGDWVFREAASVLARWRAFVPEFQISVNVSPVQFRQIGVDHAALWIDHLRAMDLPGPSLAVEITEGVLLSAEINITDKLLSFRDAGIQIALDDFGTGYSSLSYLKKFHIDYLKIDQYFVHSLEDDPDDKALCEAIIVMAHKLGLQVIAEGVETEQQRDLLLAYGCDYAQGWLYSKAIPAEEFESLLRGQAE